MLWYWLRRTGAYAFVYTSAAKMPTQRRTPTHCQGSMRCWKVWSAPFFMPGPEVWILADQDGLMFKAVYCVYGGQPGLL